MYEKQLIANGTVTPEEVTQMKTRIVNVLEDAYAKSKTTAYKAEDWETDAWEAIRANDK